jgi:hypothetical protein
MEVPVSTKQHIFHHYDSDAVRINVKVEKNSRGYNYEATITGAKSVAEAILTLDSARKELDALYGEKPRVDIAA